MDAICPRLIVMSCDSITAESARNTRATAPKHIWEVTMTIETLEHPIEPQSAIMKGA
jgi:hypothetical protein